MTVLCSACGNPTTPRLVPKGPNGPWTAFECTAGCRTPDGKYKLSTKPPKETKPTTTPQPTVSSDTNLASIAQSLKEIASILKLWEDPLEKEARKESF